MEGNMVATVVTAESWPPSRPVRTMSDEKLPFSGSWTYDITPDAQGSRVVLTEEATVPHPFFRLMVRVFGPAKYLDENLRDLGAHFGEKVVTVSQIENMPASLGSKGYFRPSVVSVLSHHFESVPRGTWGMECPAES